MFELEILSRSVAMNVMVGSRYVYPPCHLFSRILYKYQSVDFYIKKNPIKCSFSGREGLVPTNYISFLIPDLDMSSISGNTMASPAVLKKIERPIVKVVTAIYDYNASESNEISFAAGDVIDVHETEEADWWVGTVRHTKATGLFPSLMTQEIALDTNPNTRSRQSMNGLFLVRVLFDYTAVCPGELSMVSGDQIEVISQSTGSDSWWEGRNIRTNAVGQFPKDYTAPL